MVIFTLLSQDLHDPNGTVERDLWLAFEGNAIVRLFSEIFYVCSEAKIMT